MQILTLKPSDLIGSLNDAETKFAPDELYVCGHPDVFSEGPRVSIVGARKASKQGLRRADKLAKLLVSDGVVIVSGLAKGIDTAAHTATIEAGGRTIAVVGTPLNKVYPAENKALFSVIAESHCAISQFPVGKSTGPRSFPMRNRTMALLSEATVIVEASDGSGSLHQGWEAIRLGRQLFILESLLEQTDLRWPLEFLKYGAIPLNEDNVREIINCLPIRGPKELALEL
jgi:DNA processing protein